MPKKWILDEGPRRQSERATSHFGGLLFAPHRAFLCQQATEEEGTVQRVCIWAYPRSPSLLGTF